MPDYQELKTEADRRWRELNEGSRPWVRVGTAMCGQAAGAIDVLNVLNAEIERTNIDAKVDTVGCMGICYAEPLVDILKPGISRILYGNMAPSAIPGLVERVLSGNEIDF